MRLVLSLFLLSCSLDAQLLTMAFAEADPIRLAHVTCATSGGNGCTTAAIDTRGANLIVMYAAFENTTTPTYSSSPANTFIGLTAQTAVDPAGRMVYVLSPATSSTQTFTITCTGCFCTMEVAAFGNVTSFHTQNGATTAGATTLQPGSITAIDLVLTGIAAQSNVTTFSVNNSFTVSDFVAGINATQSGSALAYLIQHSTVSVNPTWTINASQTASATIGDFKK